MLIRFWYQIGEIPKKQVTYQHARSKFDLGRLLCQVVLVDNFSQEAALAALGGTLALAGCAPMSPKRRGQEEGGRCRQRQERRWRGNGYRHRCGQAWRVSVEVSAKDGAIDRITVLDSRETRVWAMWPWRR